MKFNANEILNKINTGWNLGNYLDSHDNNYLLNSTKNKSVKEITSLWGNPVFNLKCFEELKKYSINCVRITVTWCNFITIKNNRIYISNEVINHLKEIIRCAIKNEFIVILNMHHDDQTWLTVAAEKKEFNQIKKQYKKIWENIAFEFKDFNNNLIFEGMNEVIDRSNPEKFDWWGHNKQHFKNLYNLYNLFIKSVRKFSKPNKVRTLMISTYGAQIHKHALKHFKMPKDKNIIVDLHYYSKHTNPEDLKKEFDPTFEYLKNNNIPFFMGEIGMKKELINNHLAFELYFNFLKSHKIKFALWDNGSSRTFINRSTAKLTKTEITKHITNKN
jgi:endoglucanase